MLMEHLELLRALKGWLKVAFELWRARDQSGLASPEKRPSRWKTWLGVGLLAGGVSQLKKTRRASSIVDPGWRERVSAGWLHSPRVYGYR